MLKIKIVPALKFDLKGRDTGPPIDLRNQSLIGFNNTIK
jgi:hypothetical protein